MSIIEIKNNEEGRMDDIDVKIHEIPGEVHIRQTIYITDWDIFMNFLKKYWKDAIAIFSIIAIFSVALIGLCKYHDYIWHSVPQDIIVESKLTERCNRRFSDELKAAIESGEIIPSEIDVAINNGNVTISNNHISCVVTHKDYTEEELHKFSSEIRDEEASKGYYYYYFDIITEE